MFDASIPYETLQRLSLMSYIAAGLLGLIAVGIYLQTVGGIDGMKKRVETLRQRERKKEQLSPIPVTSTAPQIETAAGETMPQEETLPNETLDDDSDETRYLKNPVTEKKFKVTKTILVTHEKEEEPK